MAARNGALLDEAASRAFARASGQNERRKQVARELECVDR